MRTRKIIELYELQPQIGDIGIEIEVEGRLNFLAKNTPEKFPWIARADGSLRGHSCEWILKKPLAQVPALAAVDDLYTWMTTDHSQLQLSKRCGVHVHINCQKLTENQTFRFALLYLALENLFVRWCGEDREGNLFCLRVKDAEQLTISLAEARKRKTLHRMMNNGVRYASLNLSALNKFGSLEFRALGTPANPGPIKIWIKMLMQLRTAAGEFKRSEAIVEKMSALGADEFISRTMGARSPLLLLDTPMSREQMLREGIRSVQDILLTAPKKPRRMQREGFFIRDADIDEVPLDLGIPDEGNDFIDY